MNRFLTLLPMIVLLFTSPSSSSPRDDSTRSSQQTPKGWFLLGIEVAEGQLGPGGGLHFSLDDSWSIGLRGGFTFETTFGLVQPSEQVWWVAPMIHFTPTQGSFGTLALGIGPGLTGGIRRGELRDTSLLLSEYEKVSYRVLSVIAEIQVVLFIARGFGLTGAASTNLNSERNQSSITLGIHFDNLHTPHVEPR